MTEEELFPLLDAAVQRKVDTLSAENLRLWVIADLFDYYWRVADGTELDDFLNEWRADA